MQRTGHTQITSQVTFSKATTEELIYRIQQLLMCYNFTQAPYLPLTNLSPLSFHCVSQKDESIT